MKSILQEEIWKDIPGYDGIYQISNYGRVKSLGAYFYQNGYLRHNRAKIMSIFNNGNGYSYISLTKNGKRKNHYIHRLVASAFIGEIANGFVVNHKDYDKSNNQVDNLEIITQSENIRYSALRMKKPHKSWKISNTGEKHIYFRNGKYRVQISGKIDKQYSSFEEAIKKREMILDGR